MSKYYQNLMPRHKENESNLYVQPISVCVTAMVSGQDTVLYTCSSDTVNLMDS